MPWERARLQPKEIEALYDGQVWRRSRDIELLGVVLYRLIGMFTSDIHIDDVLEWFPHYDRQHFKAADEARAKMLRKARGR